MVFGVLSFTGDNGEGAVALTLKGFTIVALAAVPHQKQLLSEYEVERYNKYNMPHLRSRECSSGGRHGVGDRRLGKSGAPACAALQHLLPLSLLSLEARLSRRSTSTIVIERNAAYAANSWPISQVLRPV